MCRAYYYYLLSSCRYKRNIAVVYPTAMGRSLTVSRAYFNTVQSTNSIARLCPSMPCYLYILRIELKQPQAYIRIRTVDTVWTISSTSYSFLFQSLLAHDVCLSSNMRLCAISRNDVRVVQHFPFYYRNKYVPRWRIHVTMGILFGFLLAIWKGNFYYAILLLFKFN